MITIEEIAHLIIKATATSGKKIHLLCNHTGAGEAVAVCGAPLGRYRYTRKISCVRELENVDCLKCLQFLLVGMGHAKKSCRPCYHLRMTKYGGINVK